ncbi:MAG: efflux RND transporter permease subunit [Spirochaetales bacterium]|nr:efflux RND transporter permease subunit [Spirochaetales bacterium]MCF7937455.1 efflux RND transporter permease subunit [Spirochaetales bacterium]
MKQLPMVFLVLYFAAVFSILPDMKLTASHQIKKNTIRIVIPITDASAAEKKQGIVSFFEKNVHEQSPEAELVIRTSKAKILCTIYLPARSDTKDFQREFRSLLSSGKFRSVAGNNRAEILTENRILTPADLIVSFPAAFQQEIIDFTAEISGMIDVSVAKINNAKKDIDNFTISPELLTARKIDLPAIFNLHAGTPILARTTPFTSRYPMELNEVLYDSGRTGQSFNTFVNGSEAVFLSLRLKKSNSWLASGRRVNQIVEKYNHGSIIYDRTAEYRSYLREVILSFVTATAIVFTLTLFLSKDVKRGFLISGAIPFSFMATLVASTVTGCGIGISTLTSLILCSGLLVDMGIVMHEVRNRKTGRIIITASTLTTLAVFLPLFSFPGTSPLAESFILTAVSSLSASWIYALVYLPLFYSPSEKYPGYSNPGTTPKHQLVLLRPVYQVVKLKHLVMFSLSVFLLYPLLTAGGVDEQNPGFIRRTVHMPAGTTTETSCNRLLPLSHYIREKNEEVISLASCRGSVFEITLIPDNRRMLENISTLVESYVKRIPEADLLPSEGFQSRLRLPIYLLLHEQNTDRLNSIKQLVGRINRLESVEQSYLPTQSGDRHMIIDVEQKTAFRNGIRPSEILQTLQLAVSGVIFQQEVEDSTGKAGPLFTIPFPDPASIKNIFGSVRHPIGKAAAIVEYPAPIPGIRINGQPATKLFVYIERKNLHRFFTEMENANIPYLPEPSLNRLKTRTQDFIRSIIFAVFIVSGFLFLVIKEKGKILVILLMIPAALFFPLTFSIIYSIPLTDFQLVALLFVSGLTVNHGILIRLNAGGIRTIRTISFSTLTSVLAVLPLFAVHPTLNDPVISASLTVAIGVTGSFIAALLFFPFLSDSENSF